MEWYRMVWQKYAQFDGRSRRKEYWMFALVNLLLSIALCACILVSFAGRSAALGIAFAILAGLYGLAAIIPGIAVTVRRLHDIGRSGWWLLIALVPFGGIVLLVFYCLDGTPGPNEYGPDPKGRAYGAQVFTIG
ncbi:MAG: DUF805 domain-containing protein [Acidobacteriaceae bacterium]|jgi:uncharacterized membrane protein YhaH (DUF805 family)